MIWYYIDESITDGERRKGPFSIEEIRGFVREKKIVEETLVWHSGMENFVPWKEMEEAKEPESIPEEELLKQTIAALLAEQQKQKRYAGFLPRAIAFILDNLIVSSIGFIVLQALILLNVIDLSSFTETLVSMQSSGNESFSEILDAMMNDPSTEILVIATSIFQALYFIIFTAVKGATPGKMALRMKVETAEGTAVGWVASITRYIASMFTQFTLMLYGFGYLIVMIDPKRRALHDHIARTRVVMYSRVKIIERPKNEQEK